MDFAEQRAMLTRNPPEFLLFDSRENRDWVRADVEPPMLLNSETVVHYLLQRGHVTFDSAIDGDLMVLEVLRRNRNFKILRKNSKGLFLKQIQHWEPQAQSTLQREASAYRLAFNAPELTATAGLLPKFYDYDPLRHVLILELLSGSEAVSDKHLRLQIFPIDIAAAMAQALATYHTETRKAFDVIERNAIFQKTVPWILAIHHQQAAWFSSLSAANSQLLQIVKKYPSFQEELDVLRKDWRFETLIHGDVKWDNCMIEEHPADAQTDGPKVKIVDWELAELGDPLWDAGAILQSYLSHWILSMPAAPHLSPEDLIAQAPIKLESVQPAIQSFWTNYKKCAGIAPERARDAMLRSVRYGAARMIQTAYESLTFSPHMSSTVLYLLQVSMNVLVNTEEAASELFGLHEA